MVVPLPEGETLIGRDPANQIWISDGSLSRRHCVVARRDAEIIIRDLGSRNGTRVNGMPVEERLLENQDQIAVVLRHANVEAADDAITRYVRNAARCRQVATG